jgi:hypothetical protein
MKKVFAVFILLALGLAVGSCGSGTPTNAITTSTTGNWEAQLTGGTAQASQLNFVTGFNVTDTTGISNEPLDVTAFAFINNGKCFTNGTNGTTWAGSATLITGSSGQVSGSLTFVVTSATSSNVLTLNTSPTGGVSGTSNGTTTTTGTLSGGIAWGTWQLTGGQGDPSCQGTGNFIMCQGTATCTIP